jgi:hypothetical protein
MEKPIEWQPREKLGKYQSLYEGRTKIRRTLDYREALR